MFLVFSCTLSRISHLYVFLGIPVWLLGKRREGESSAVIGWGHKPTADKARDYAAKHNLPYIALEDGFLRSLDLGCKGAQPLSLVVDHTGIYYDATEPSDLENLLNGSGWESEEQLQSAQHAIEAIKRHDLSKYNHAPRAAERLLGDASCPRVLVLDQTKGDTSVTLGRADAESFTAMLDDAQMRFPTARLFVKTHPDVLAGKKQGYLTEAAKRRGIAIIAQDVSPLSLLAQADVVYTVTSQMGFEALLLAKEVHCFGMPFYAGWGVTHDRLTCPRRIKRRTVEEIFAAAYMLYARYVNPVTAKRCDIHETIRLLAAQRFQNERNKGFHACVGFSRWKRPHARAFLQSTTGTIRFFSDWWKAIKWAQANGGDVVVWASKCTIGLESSCQTMGVRLIRMEDGFIRSVGLGSDFNWPYSLVLDEKGIYYDPSRPSGLEDILNTLPKHPERAELCSRASTLRGFIVEKGITKYNTGVDAVTRGDFSAKGRLLLVPGQVEDDASVRLGGCGLFSNVDLLKAVRERHPDAFIIYKPHPDVESRNRKGRIPDGEALRYADRVVRNVRMDVLLGIVDEVHTLTSLTGFEALLRGIEVHTYGGPFYAGWGLTHDRVDFPRRKARLSLEELIAGTLILYPSYYDWQTKGFCTPEDICYRLTQPKGQKRGKFFMRTFAALREKIRNVF